MEANNIKEMFPLSFGFFFSGCIHRWVRKAVAAVEIAVSGMEACEDSIQMADPLLLALLLPTPACMPL